MCDCRVKNFILTFGGTDVTRAGEGRGVAWMRRVSTIWTDVNEQIRNSMYIDLL